MPVFCPNASQRSPNSWKSWAGKEVNWVKNCEKASVLPKCEPTKPEVLKELSWQGGKMGKKLRKSQLFTQFEPTKPEFRKELSWQGRKLGKKPWKCQCFAQMRANGARIPGITELARRKNGQEIPEKPEFCPNANQSNSIDGILGKSWTPASPQKKIQPGYLSCP